MGSARVNSLFPSRDIRHHGRVEPAYAHETPREAARRRKCEAADRDGARLRETHAEAAVASRQMGEKVRDFHARAFTAPFATVDNDSQRNLENASGGSANVGAYCNHDNPDDASYRRTPA